MFILDVLCKDWDASYDTSTQKCQCATGLTDTNYGCLPFSNANTAANLAIKNEIIRRFAALRDAGQWSEMSSASSKYWPKLTKFWDQMYTKTEKKVVLSCGKKSRGANSGYYQGQ